MKMQEKRRGRKEDEKGNKNLKRYKQAKRKDCMQKKNYYSKKRMKKALYKIPGQNRGRKRGEMEKKEKKLH